MHSLLYVRNERSVLVPVREHSPSAERLHGCGTETIFSLERDKHEEAEAAIPHRARAHYVIYEDGSWQWCVFSGIHGTEVHFSTCESKPINHEQPMQTRRKKKMSNISFDAETKETIARNLCKMREDLNLTRSSLARKIGVSIDSVKNWEAGKNIPSLENMVALGKLYGIDPRRLFGELVVKRAEQIAEMRGCHMPELPPVRQENTQPEPKPAPAPLFQAETPPSSNLSGFRESIMQALLSAARVTTDPAIKKYVEMLDMIDVYEGREAA